MALGRPHGVRCVGAFAAKIRGGVAVDTRRPDAAPFAIGSMCSGIGFAVARS
jgi:hypothetical protein